VVYSMVVKLVWTTAQMMAQQRVAMKVAWSEN